MLLLKRNEMVGWVLLLASAATLAYVLRYTFKHADPTQRRRMYVALLLVGGAVVFWTLFLQAGTSLNLFADRNTDLRLLSCRVVFELFGKTDIPWDARMLVAAGVVDSSVWIDTQITAGQVQSFNVAFVLIFAPVFSWLWTWLADRGWEPGPVAKFGYGLLQVGLGFLVIVLSVTLADDQFRLPLFVLGLTYLLHTTGELFVSPVGMAELTKLSPPMLVSTMMAVWLLTSSIAQFLGALIASFAGTETVAGRVLSPERALQSSVAVFEYVGWAGIGCGLVVPRAQPICSSLAADPVRTGPAASRRLRSVASDGFRARRRDFAHLGRIARLLGEQLFDALSELLPQVGVILAAGRRCEARVNRSHRAVTTDEHCRGPRVQVHQLRHLLPHLSRARRRSDTDTSRRTASRTHAHA